MALVVGFPHEDPPEGAGRRKGERIVRSQRQHPLAGGIAEELAPAVEQFQGVPLAGIVRSGDDDAAVGPVVGDGQFRARSGAETDADDIGAAAHERALDEPFDHRARNARVAPDDDGKFFAGTGLGDATHVGRRESHDVDRREVVARRAADRTPDARNGLDECHIR